MIGTGFEALVVTYTAAQLEQTLYHATDIAGRCLLPFLLLGQTAWDIKHYQALNESERGIEIGADKRYYTKEALSTLRTLASNIDMNYGMKDFVEDDHGFTWNYHNVPIRLRMIKRHYGFFQNPDFAWYKAEEYKIPNPFASYWKARHLIQ